MGCNFRGEWNWAKFKINGKKGKQSYVLHKHTMSQRRMNHLHTRTESTGYRYVTPGRQRVKVASVPRPIKHDIGKV